MKLLMKTRYKILLSTSIIIIVVFSSFLVLNMTYEYPPPGMKDLVLEQHGCSIEITQYLRENSNIFDEDFNGNFDTNLPGLPEGVSQESFDKCLDVLLGKN